MLRDPEGRRRESKKAKAKREKEKSHVIIRESFNWRRVARGSLNLVGYIVCGGVESEWEIGGRRCSRG